MRSLAVDYREGLGEFAKLQSLSRNLGALDSAYQKLVAEIALLRLFYITENAFFSVACKLLCGCLYVDGSAPVLLAPASSTRAAERAMRTHSRPKPRDLKWSKAKEIKENLRFVMDASDHFVRSVDFHGTLIDEIRRIRNRIAHNNPRSRSNFQVVVRRYYGASLNHVTPGTLLLSPRHSPPLIDSYLAQMAVLLKTLTRS